MPSCSSTLATSASSTPLLRARSRMILLDASLATDFAADFVAINLLLSAERQLRLEEQTKEAARCNYAVNKRGAVSPPAEPAHCETSTTAAFTSSLCHAMRKGFSAMAGFQLGLIRIMGQSTPIGKSFPRAAARGTGP